MKPGPLEIILIIAVVIAVAVIARIMGAGRRTSQKKGASSPDTTTDTHGKNKLRGVFNRTGIVMIIAGIAALIATVSLFRWVLQSYLWAFILIAIGCILVLSARRKK